jgi:prevent-host-death family protein
MSRWSIADAKARFSELVLKVAEGPQRVTKRGRDVAVVVTADEYERLQSAADQKRNHPMQAFLEAAANLRGGDDLGLTVPPRRRRKGRPDPFGGAP